MRARNLRIILFSSALALCTAGLAQAQSPAVGSQAKSGMAPAVAAPKVVAPAPAKAELLDINSAGKADLIALKGIGEKRADDIIKGRPYKGKDDLVQKKILTKSVYDEIKDKIIAKQK